MMGASVERERGVMGRKRRERGKPAKSCVANLRKRSKM